MTAAEVTELVEVATAAACAGAEVAMAAWRDRGQLTVETKADPDDLVTQADRRTQDAVFAVVRCRRPADVLRGEEAGSPPAGSPGGVEWWVDPIDGTTSFVYGRADWSVSVAAVDGGTGQILAGAVVEPVVGAVTTAGVGQGAWCDGRRLRVRPTRDLVRAIVEVNLGSWPQRELAGAMVARLAPTVRDLRRGGSAAAALAGLAAGRADAVWVPGLQQWDGAAGVLLAAEAGATVGDLDGETGARWPASGNVLAAPASLWGELRGLLAPLYAGG